MGYFDNLNRDLLDRLDSSAATVVELGCGAGALGAAFRARAPMARLIGVEAHAPSATAARAVFDTVVAADIESEHALSALDAALAGQPIDQLVIGDVLEHLRDPWAVLAALRCRMRPGGRAAICLPNAAHWSLLHRQLAGDWTYADHGLLDRTHLRFFTRDSAVAMFRGAGFAIEAVTARPTRADRGARARAAIAALGGAAEALGLDRASAARNLMPLQWLFTLRAGRPVPERRLHAVGIRGKALSLSTVRLAQPLSALAGHRPMRVSEAIGEMVLPTAEGPPGILITYRLHPFHDSPVWPAMDRLAAAGWLILHDLDDHPAYLRAQRVTDYRSIRAAHAVTVTTAALAEVVRPFNPHVHLVPNQIFDLAAPREAALAPPDGPIRALFAAINREADWRAQCRGLEAALAAGELPVRLSLVNAPDLAERIGPSVRSFPFLDYPAYRREMLAADVVLAPLTANEFNACKSDLKIVESLAHGCVAIVSAEAAGQSDVPRDLLCVADGPRDWARHLHSLAADAEMLAERKAAGFDWVIRHRMWHAHVVALDGLHDRLIADLPALDRDRRARLAAMGYGGAKAG